MKRLTLISTLSALALAVTAADLSFQQVILDSRYIAYERDVGDMDGDGDLVTVQEGDTTFQIFRAPNWTRSTLVTFSGAFRYPRADDLKLADMDGDGDLDIVGIRNWNSAPTYLYRNRTRSAGAAKIP